MKVVVLLFFGIFYVHSQHLGSLTGRVLDRNVQTPVPYALVQVLGDTAMAVEADSLGFYELSGVPIGGYRLEAVLDGYHKASFSILVEQSVLSKHTIYLEEDITKLETVTLYSEQDNPYKVTSSYQFEAKDFATSATSFGDPSRLVQTLPGVAAASDGSNQVAVRGNSPFNNNWYLEGIEIPNPNHFGGYGSSGGFISVFNENTLEKFDFYLSAYPAMYGNSNSSVFDMKLRAGNTRKREHNVRISPLGVYAGAEGYFRKGKRSCYIVNGRIFDLYLFKKWGLVPKSDISIPAFKDFSYKVSFPSKNNKAELTVFGFGGVNKLDIVYRDRMEVKHNKFYCNNLGFDYKLSHKIRLNSILQWSVTSNHFEQEDPSIYKTSVAEHIIRNHTYVQLKQSSKVSHRVGLRVSYKSILSSQPTGYYLDTTLMKAVNVNTTQAVSGLFSEAYINSLYRLAEATRFYAGLYAANVSFNKRVSIEPRLGLTSKLGKRYEIGFSSGLYSKVSSFYVYQSSGNNLPLTRSFQLVNAHTLLLDSTFTVKSELFYQYLWNVYLSTNPSLPEAAFLSTDDLFKYKDQRVDALSKGQNYGVDITLNKRFPYRVQLMLSSALYRSQYMDSKGRWTNTMYDNKFTSAVQVSKEIVKNKTYGLKSMVFSAKALYFGGFYQIPIDYQRSAQYDQELVYPHLLYNQKLPNYFRLDLGFQVGYARPRIKHELRIDIQNTTNRKNPLKQYYDKTSRTIRYLYQLPIIPVISYTAYF